MSFLIDTNIVIFILKRGNPRGAKAAERFEEAGKNEISVSAIVAAELYHGAEKYGRPDNRKSLVTRFLAPHRSIPFDSQCVPHYARIRHHLEKQGTVIGGNDLMIAATALAHDLTLITHNCREFERVPDLKWEDWS